METLKMEKPEVFKVYETVTCVFAPEAAGVVILGQPCLAPAVLAVCAVPAGIGV